MTPNILAFTFFFVYKSDDGRNVFYMVDRQPDCNASRTTWVLARLQAEWFTWQTRQRTSRDQMTANRSINPCCSSSLIALPRPVVHSAVLNHRRPPTTASSIDTDRKTRVARPATMTSKLRTLPKLLSGGPIWLHHIYSEIGSAGPHLSP